MLDFRIHSTSMYNPISLCFEKREAFPLLTYRYLTVIQHHPNVYLLANPFEKEILDRLIEQKIISRINASAGSAWYGPTPEYLLNMHHINSLQDTASMNPALTSASYKRYVGFVAHERHPFQEFLASLTTEDMVTLELEVTPFLEDHHKSERSFSKSFHNIHLVAPYNRKPEGVLPRYILEGQLLDVFVELLNQGMTSVQIILSEDNIVLHPKLFRGYQTLPSVTLLPE